MPAKWMDTYTRTDAGTGREHYLTAAEWPDNFGATTMQNERQSVTRYVPTYINASGMRTLMRRAQGRDTFATAKEADRWIETVTRNNSPSTIREVWGDDPRFEVRPCPCYPGHHDPQTVWFD